MRVPPSKAAPRSAEPLIVTFGCRLNLFESEVVRGHARAMTGQTVVVNTCAVTAEAERQARQSIRRLRREHPEATIVVTGCSAQIAPDAYAAMPEVDHVLGNAEKLRADAWSTLQPDSERVQVADIDGTHVSFEAMPQDMPDHSRALLQVQNGCDHRCTFCIIPFGRGPSRSVPLGMVVERTRHMLAQGYNEVVLSGVDLTAWGADLPGRPTLGQLVRRLLALAPDLPRLRLSSIDVAEVDDDLWRAIAEEERLMPHFHLSLQAGDDMILKRMKRRHCRADTVTFSRKVRALRPDAGLGADLIAGFPTEDEAMFARSLELVEECGLAFVHVFPYSARAGTPAARMPQLPTTVRRERAARLRAAARRELDGFLQRQLGRRVEVVAERDGTGRAPNGAPVVLAAPGTPRSLQRVQLTSIDGDRLVGVSDIVKHAAQTAPHREAVLT